MEEVTVFNIRAVNRGMLKAYSQPPAAKGPIGAGVLLADNGNQLVYRHKNQKGIASARQNTRLF
jgi:hypothetical protein